MTMTLSVKNLPNTEEHYRYYDQPIHIGGQLLLEDGVARLYDWDLGLSVPLADPEACAAARAFVGPPGDYLGGALLRAWVRRGPEGPELHGVYWFLLGDLANEPASKWGPMVDVRPVPARWEDRPREAVVGYRPPAQDRPSREAAGLDVVVGYLDAAVDLATSRGYLPLRPGLRWLRDAPEWLVRLQQPGGVELLESRLGVPIPASVREFWENPPLVRLLDSWRWQDYLADEPAVIIWDSKKHLLVCTHPHSGGIGAVDLSGGADPPLYWGWEGEQSPMKLAAGKFSEHVSLSLQRGPD